MADDPDDGTSRLQHVSAAAVQLLSMAGCAVHVVSKDGASGVAASTDVRSTRLADVSFTTGDGPGIEAFTLRRPVLVSDLSGERQRWPGFIDVAVGAGISAVYCYPLQVGGVTLGVLDLYSDRARALDSDEVSLALAYSHLAALTILDDQALQEHGSWEPLVDHRAEIHQAQGMVMVDLGVDLADALLRMRAHAFSEGRPLIEIAQAIIRGLVLPAAEAREAT
jgi:hypothetical protein